MIDSWYIDDIDIFKAYNVGITKGGFNDLLLFPSLVEPDYNDWPEHHGIEVDLSNPILQNKTVSIPFASIDPNHINVDNFFAFITQSGYHSLYVKSLGRTWKLRMSKEKDRSVFRKWQSFAVDFVDDFPRALLNSAATRKGHNKGNLAKLEYLLDGIRFDEYGIIVEKGKAEVYKIPALKKNLERNSKFSDSVSYDADFVRFQSKDVTLKCALYCDTVSNFWQNYSSFFRDLIKPNLRALTVEYAKDTYPCFYKSTSSLYFYKGVNYVLFKFDLTLTFTKFRPLVTYFVWGTEAKEIIITEDNINTIIHE